MSTEHKYPIQIQADNQDAADSQCLCMCHVFDKAGLVCVMQALQKQYCHVIAYDANGDIVDKYDNR